MTVSYQGEGPLYFSIDGGPWQELPRDPKTGEATVPAPQGASVLVFSNRNDSDPQEAIVTVLSTGEN